MLDSLWLSEYVPLPLRNRRPWNGGNGQTTSWPIGALASCGSLPPVTAELLGLHVITVHDTIRKFNDGGIPAIIPLRGTPPLL
jgi:hypothetical protein